jgi:hypothetical protein
MVESASELLDFITLRQGVATPARPATTAASAAPAVGPT